MNYGKLTQTVYDRTVSKTIQAVQKTGNRKINGAELGADCAIFPIKKVSENTDMNTAVLATGQALAHGMDMHVAYRAFMAADNQIACRGIYGNIEFKSASFIYVVPEKLREIKVRKMIETAAKAVEEFGAATAGVQVQALPSVTEVAVTCTVQAFSHNIDLIKGAKPDEDVVMTKWIALEGTSIIACARKEELFKRYPSDIIDTAAGFVEQMSIAAEAALAFKSGVSAMQAVREGGIFGGLWELAQNSGVGLVIDLKKIPVRQETIEVCEYFDLNPYELLSGGCLLAAAPNGEGLVRTFMENGISAAVIGNITAGNDRIICRDEENRYLEPAKGDEVFRF